MILKICAQTGLPLSSIVCNVAQPCQCNIRNFTKTWNSMKSRWSYNVSIIYTDNWEFWLIFIQCILLFINEYIPFMREHVFPCWTKPPYQISYRQCIHNLILSACRLHLINLNKLISFLFKGACYDFWPDLIHFLFYSIFEQASLEQSNSKVWANIMYVAVLILYVKVHFKSVRRLKRGKFVFYSR